MDDAARLAQAARRRGVRDDRVLAAIRAVDRARFVPADQRPFAATDAPVRISRGQVTTQPSLVAQMVGALELVGDERVLEVGTGLGYQAAVLAQLVAEVVTVERFADLADRARRNLADAGVANVTVVVGDGTKGWPQTAPYDAVVVAAAFTEVPRPLREQLRQGGRLVQPLGPGGAEEVVLHRRRGDRLERVGTVVGARFVRLVGELGFPEDDGQ